MAINGDETVPTALADDTHEDTSTSSTTSSNTTMDDWITKILQDNEDGDQQQQQQQQRQRRTRVAMAWFGGTVGIIGGLTAPFVFTKTILPYMATPKTKVERALRYCLQQQQKRSQTRSRPQPPPPPPPQQQRPLPVFVDLGSGDGEAVKQAAKLGYYAVGLELNWTMWFVSSIRRLLFFTKEERSRSKIIYGNMFDHSLGPISGHNNNDDDTTAGSRSLDLNNSHDMTHNQQQPQQHAVTFSKGWDADVVMIFGVTPLMASISRKLQSECKPGTYILAYRFAIPLFRPSSSTTSTSTMDDSSNNLLHGQIIYDLEEMRIYEKIDDTSTAEHHHHHIACKDDDEGKEAGDGDSKQHQ